MPKENPPKINSVENMSIEELRDEAKNTKMSENFFKKNRNAKQKRRLEDIRNELDRRKEAEENSDDQEELNEGEEEMEYEYSISELEEILEDRRGMYEQSLKEKYSKKQIEYFKTAYDHARVALGQKMYDERKSSLEQEGKSNIEIEGELYQYRANEIYQKIHIEEEARIMQTKAEILPSTAQKVLSKTWDWSKKALQKYSELNKMGKTLFKIGSFEVTTGFLSKLAVTSTIVTGASVAFGFLAPGALGLSAGKRFLRGVVGATTAGVYAKTTQKLFTRDRKNSEEQKKNIKHDFDSGKINTIEYEERLNVIEKHYRNEQRFLTLAQIGSTFLVGLSASMAAGNMMENTNVDTEHTKTNIEDKNPETENDPTNKNTDAQEETKGDAESQEENAEENTDTQVEDVEELKPFTIEVNSRGAIATIEDLKGKLKLQYPDISKAPDNIKYVLNTNSVSLSEKWGFLSNDANESAMMLKGSTISVDSKGNITLHNLGKGETVLSGENAEKYHDKMFDYDGQKASTSNYEARGSGTPERSANVVDNDPNPDESELVSREEIEKMAENNRTENTGEVDRSGENVVTDDKGNRAPVEDNSLGENRERSFVDTYKENVAAYNEEARLEGKNINGYRTNNGPMNTTNYGMQYSASRPRFENLGQDNDVQVNEQEQIDYIAEQEFRSEVNEIFGRRFLGTPISDGIKTNEWAYLKDSKISIGEKGAVTLTTENGTVSGRGADDVYESSGGGRSAKVVDRLEKFIKNQDIKPTSGESVEAYLKRVARAQK